MPTILIVDDNATNRDFLGTLLRYRGHQTIEVASGEEGIAALASAPPDLVIADVLMPDVDGFEFVRRLRTNPATASTEVIFYTAAFEQDEARALAAHCGVSHLITKPAEPEYILNVVDAALAQPSTASATPIDEFDREHRRLFAAKLLERTSALDSLSKRQSMLVQLAQQFLIEQSPTQLLLDLCLATRRFFGVELAVLYSLDEETGAIRAETGTDVDAGAFRPFDVTQPPPAFDLTRHGGAPARLTGTDHDMFRAWLPDRYGPMAQMLQIPLGSARRCFGWLCLFEPRAELFNAEDLSLAISLSAQFSLIYANAVALDALRHEKTHRGAIEEALVQSQKMEALGQMAGHLAHDTNNILHVLKWNLSVLDKAVVGEKERKAVTTGAMAVERCEALVRNLLAFARKEPLEPRVIVLGDQLSRLADILRQSIGPEIQLTIDTADDLWPVVVDPTKLDVALLNLAVNAKHAMANGGALRIDCVNCGPDPSRSGDFVRITVADSGTGMPPEIVKRAFEPRFTTKPQGYRMWVRAVRKSSWPQLACSRL